MNTNLNDKSDEVLMEPDSQLHFINTCRAAMADKA